MILQEKISFLVTRKIISLTEFLKLVLYSFNKYCTEEIHGNTVETDATLSCLLFLRVLGI